ncbi:MAG: acyltransferase family protein [Muribaculaceae bacterium]
MTIKQPSGRLLSLDILRGVTIAGMILVNNPGSWGDIFAPLRHAAWNGLTPTDLVFPFFMFIMGISTYFSLRKFQFQPSRPLMIKIFRRTVLIYLIGLFIAWFSNFCYGLSRADAALPLSVRLADAANSFGHLRLVGVLPRLAICYCAASLIAVFVRHRLIPWIIAGILALYSIILLVGHGYDFSTDNIIYIVDSAILGDSHIYHGLVVDGVNIAFDPEGLLSTLPAIAHVLIGFVCGEAIMSTKDNLKRISDLFIIGTIMMFAGFLLDYGLPINKNIWSPTFVLTTCGLAASFLGLLIWIIDIKGYKAWSRFFESFGINPLFLYVLGGVLAILFGSVKVPFAGDMISIKSLIYKEALLPLLGDATTASCIYAILFVCLNWSIGYILYKKKIYIKI